MPRHVIVDGSNLATEGRSMPSLKQLSDAVEAYMADHPDDLITVVVDATFGHRIDPKEIPEFEAAIEHNEMVAPPAGAVGRGDGFVLAIADKVKALVLSNDSYQEFHGQYDWLFDEGRLIGGKPVPHVGWVFVPRVPVRGPISRKSQRDARRGSERPVKGAPRDVAADNTVRTSVESNQPMPIPKAPPPGARPARRATPPAVEAPAAAATPKVAPPARNEMVNELMPFLEFVERRPVGSLVEATIEVYSSHGVYAMAAGARVYLPLRNISDPPPRTARELFKIGETIELQVAAFHAARRGIDVAVAGVVAGLEAPAPPASADAKPVRRRGRSAPSADAAESPASVDVSEDATLPSETMPARPARRRGRADVGEPAVDAPSAAAVRAVAGRRPGRRSAGSVEPLATVEAVEVTEPPTDALPDADGASNVVVDLPVVSGGQAGGGAPTAELGAVAKPTRRRSSAATGAVLDEATPAPTARPSRRRAGASNPEALVTEPATRALDAEAPVAADATTPARPRGRGARVAKAAASPAADGAAAPAETAASIEPDVAPTNPMSEATSPVAAAGADVVDDNAETDATTASTSRSAARPRAKRPTAAAPETVADKVKPSAAGSRSRRAKPAE